jgi:uncharacterized protein
MAPRVDKLDIGTLGLSSGEGRSLDLEVPVEELSFGEQTYSAGGHADARLDVSHTTTGHAMRLRFAVNLHGPCTRCLEDANATVDVDSREIDEPAGDDESGSDEELRSPYVSEGELDLGSWARDALALALPTRILCMPDCAGLCAVCGANLNEDPAHAHEPEPDPRWAKLAELQLDPRDDG